MNSNSRTRVTRARDCENESENAEKHCAFNRRERWKNRASMGLLLLVCAVSAAILFAMFSNALQK